MKILIVKDPLNRAMIQGIIPWLAGDTLLTDNPQLAQMSPHTVRLQSTRELVESIRSGKYDFAVAYNSPQHVVDDDYFLASINGNKVIVNDQRVFYTPQTIIREIHTPSGATLRPYQVQMVEFVLKKKRAGLFVDMGLGKTLATLAAINELLTNGELNPTKPILIVAPIMVALDTWSREAEKWGYDIDVLVNIRLSKKKRAKLFEQLDSVNKPTILTTNPEQLDNIINHYTDRYEPFPFECVVIDELSLFKSSETKRFTNMSMLTKNVKYFIGLTGTPAPNSLLDIWSQMMLIDPANKQLLSENFYKYRSHYFEPDMVNKNTCQVYKWKLKPNADQAIFERMRPTVIALRSEGLVDLPELTFIDEEISLPPNIMKAYREFEKEIRSQFQDDEQECLSTIDGDEIVVRNRAVLASKLLQLAAGAVYTEDPSEPYIVYHNAKFERLKEIVETATSPILVFYNFKSDIERARKFIEFETLRSNDPNVRDVIRRWNNGEIPVLFVHPQSAGHGLNIQDGGHTIIWLTMTWMNEVYRQANARLHRTGQTKPVQVIHLIAQGTIDTEVIARLNDKEDGQQNLLNALKPN